MNVDEDIVDGGCKGEVFCDEVIGEKEVGGDGVMNEGDKSSTTLSPRGSLQSAMQFGKEFVGRTLVNDITFFS